MPHSPLAITVSPVTVSLPAGVTSVNRQVTVINSGTQAITVHSRPLVVPMGKQTCGNLKAAPNWSAVSPASFTLKPGQHETARLVIHAPAGTHADIAAVFTATGKPAPGHPTLAGSVGSQVVINGAGSCHTKAFVPASHSGQVPLLAVAIGVILFAALLTAILAAVVRRGRHRAA